MKKKGKKDEKGPKKGSSNDSKLKRKKGAARPARPLLCRPILTSEANLLSAKRLL